MLINNNLINISFLIIIYILNLINIEKKYIQILIIILIIILIGLNNYENIYILLNNIYEYLINNIKICGGENIKLLNILNNEKGHINYLIENINSPLIKGGNNEEQNIKKLEDELKQRQAMLDIISLKTNKLSDKEIIKKNLDINKVNKNIEKSINQEKTTNPEKSKSIISKVSNFMSNIYNKIMGKKKNNIETKKINKNLEETNISTSKYLNKIEDLKLTEKDLLNNRIDTNINKYDRNKKENLNINDLTENKKYYLNEMAEKYNINDRQINLNKLYNTKKLIKATENLCLDKEKKSQNKYKKYNNLILDINKINKNNKNILEPYNDEEYGEYICINKPCDKYKDKYSRMDCVY